MNYKKIIKYCRIGFCVVLVLIAITLFLAFTTNTKWILLILYPLLFCLMLFPIMIKGCREMILGKEISNAVFLLPEKTYRRVLILIYILAALLLLLQIYVSYAESVLPMAKDNFDTGIFVLILFLLSVNHLIGKKPNS